MFTRNEITETNMVPTTKRYPWHELEEFFPDGGMWRTPVRNAEYYAHAAAELMANRNEFAEACLTALDRWPRSCEVAFGTPGLNLRAWLGHAACFIHAGSPEETTRQGWHELDDGERVAANDAADEAIHAYRRRMNPYEQAGLWG